MHVYNVPLWYKWSSLKQSTRFDKHNILIWYLHQLVHQPTWKQLPLTPQQHIPTPHLWRNRKYTSFFVFSLVVSSLLLRRVALSIFFTASVSLFCSVIPNTSFFFTLSTPPSSMDRAVWISLHWCSMVLQTLDTDIMMLSTFIPLFVRNVFQRFYVRLSYHVSLCVVSRN